MGFIAVLGISPILPPPPEPVPYVASTHWRKSWISFTPGCSSNTSSRASGLISPPIDRAFRSCVNAAADDFFGGSGVSARW